MDKKLWRSFFLNLLIAIGELIGGIVSKSLVLISDSIHNFTDSASLILTILARKWSRKPPDDIYTYGRKRIEIIVAAINALVLFSVSIFIAKEAVARLFHSESVKSTIMLWVAIGAVITKGISVLAIRNHNKDDLNIRSTFIHLLHDMALSILVVIVALFSSTTIGLYLDSIASLLISLMIFWLVYIILEDIYHILVQSTPEEINLNKLIDDVNKKFIPATLKHVHIWEIVPGDIVMTGEVSPGHSKSKKIVLKIKKYLYKKYKIGHITLEII